MSYQDEWADDLEVDELTVSELNALVKKRQQAGQENEDRPEDQ